MDYRAVYEALKSPKEIGMYIISIIESYNKKNTVWMVIIISIFDQEFIYNSISIQKCMEMIIWFQLFQIPIFTYYYYYYKIKPFHLFNQSINQIAIFIIIIIIMIIIIIIIITTPTILL